MAMRRPVWVLLAIGVILLALGLMRDEHFVVLRKAMMICLECIGIG